MSEERETTTKETRMDDRLVSATQMVDVFGRVMRDLQDAERAFREDSTTENCAAFLRARHDYFVLAREMDRLFAVAAAVGDATAQDGIA